MHALRPRASFAFTARAPACTTAIRCKRLLSTAASSRPWFVDPEPDNVRHLPPHLLPKTQDFPPNLPVSIKELFAKLSQSPFLEPSTLEVKEPTPIPPGPALPKSIPKGRRKRGRTYSGEGLAEEQGGIWSWIVTAQVKDGTENRGSIEAVVRLVRKTLLKMDPPVILPPNSKRRGHHGWAMVDAGNFAVHIVSREARQKFFLNQSQW
ncbi:hypothetical protein PAXINDRAFT_112742 [Paxillus involutus ATCC 200175]|nr:hypothetical protein PAXINDRAFT_112742 [Paxillus involutus ATCC 200175]